MKLKKFLKTTLVFSLMMMLCMAFSDKVNAAETNYYVNDNNVSMTKSQYDHLSDTFSDVSISVMTQEQFNHEMAMNYRTLQKDEKYLKVEIKYDKNKQVTQVKNTEISKEEYDSVPTEQTRTACASFYPDGCWETTYKKLEIIYQGATSTHNERLALINHWKIMPSVRSHDVIGLWYNQYFTRTGYEGHNIYTRNNTNYGTTYNSSTNSSYIHTEGSSGTWLGGGVGISMKLSEYTNITYMEEQLFVEGHGGSHLEVRGSYQHATTAVTKANSMNYVFAPLGLGNVFGFGTDAIWNSYDAMLGVSITW